MVDFETIVKWIEFDIRASEYLNCVGAPVTSKNLEIVQDIFEENIDKLFYAILSIDEVRKSKQNIVMECRRKRPCTRVKK